MQYKATYNEVVTSISVYVEVPDDVIERHTYDSVLDEQAIEDYVAETSHDLASEAMQTWGIYKPVLFDGSLDGVGADDVEQVDE